MENQLETKLTPTEPIPFKPTQTKREEGVNLNIKNMQNIHFEIQRKKYSEQAYYATKKNVVQVITDYDELPYRRWYRGFPESDVPIVAEREAGFRPLIRKIYIENKKQPEQCFEENRRWSRQGSGRETRQGSERESKQESGRESKQESERESGRESRQGSRQGQKNGSEQLQNQNNEEPRNNRADNNGDYNGNWGDTDYYTQVMLRTI